MKTNIKQKREGKTMTLDTSGIEVFVSNHIALVSS